MVYVSELQILCDLKMMSGHFYCVCHVGLTVYVALV